MYVDSSAEKTAASALKYGSDLRATSAEMYSVIRDWTSASPS
ncbi:hypothetical protein ACETU7_14925 [Rhodococcus sp. 3Y1]